MGNTLPVLLKFSDVSEMAQISERTTRRWIQQGVLRAVASAASSLNLLRFIDASRFFPPLARPSPEEVLVADGSHRVGPSSIASSLACGIPL